MLGLAIMAAKLAYQRCGYGTDHVTPDLMVPRARLRPNDRFRRSREYYRICDRITRGEKP